MGQEIPEDFGLLAGQLAQSEYLFQVSSGSPAADLYHQCHWKYRWILSKVHFDYIRDASDALYPISLRMVSFAVKEGMYETVITNLPADQFPPLLLRKLYHKCWGIETSFRDLKR